MNLSFEFFPARTPQGVKKLQLVQAKLSQLSPEYFSVTSGAGGSTGDATFAMIKQIKDTTKIPATPHISCIGVNQEQILQTLKNYQQIGINTIVALRGDIPSGVRGLGDFNYAYQLVEFIQNNFNNFKVIVAAYPEKHPQAKNIQTDIKHLLIKLKAGADIAITQYFYNIDSFLYFRDEIAKQTNKKIIPGIMPITNYQNLVRFSNMCGAQIPRWILNKLELYQNDEQSLKSFGLEVVNNLCQNLKKHEVKDFHFYSMNQIESTFTLAKNLT